MTQVTPKHHSVPRQCSHGAPGDSAAGQNQNRPDSCLCRWRQGGVGARQGGPQGGDGDDAMEDDVGTPRRSESGQDSSHHEKKHPVQVGEGPAAEWSPPRSWTCRSAAATGLTQQQGRCIWKEVKQTGPTGHLLGAWGGTWVLTELMAPPLFSPQKAWVEKKMTSLEVKEREQGDCLCPHCRPETGPPPRQLPRRLQELQG